MRFFRILTFYAAGLCLVGQTPPTTPAPPASATPVAPSTPATPAPVASGPDTVTVPLQIFAPAVIPGDRVVIQVGDVKLTSAEIGYILDVYPINQRAFANGAGRPQFIDSVVRAILLSEEGKRRKLNETEAYKTQVGYSQASILATHTDAEIKRGVAADEPALRAYLEARKDQYEQIHARHILIRMKGSPVTLLAGQKDLTEEEALAKIQEIRQKLENGADFAELARTESNDVRSNAKDGDLGFVKHGQYPPSFEEPAFALPIGVLSQPVKSPYGYHLIKVEERKLVKTFEELRSELEKNLGTETSRKFVENLKAKTKVVIDPEFSEPSTGPAVPKP